MDPPKINYVNNNCLMVINTNGKMRQLFTPFRVQVLYPTSVFKQHSWVYVEEVKEHKKHLIIYRIGAQWWPFGIFSIQVGF